MRPTVTAPEFSRRSALVSGALLLGAAVVSASPARSAAVARDLLRRAVRLRETGGAVWAWQLEVRGRADAPVTVTVAGTAYDVENHGKRFTAVVDLRPGTNTVEAAAGGDEDAAVYDVPMAARPTAVAVAIVSGSDLVLDARGSRSAVPTGAELVAYRWEQRGGDDLLGLPASGAVVRMPRPEGPGPWYVDLWVTDRVGAVDRSGVTLLGGDLGAVPAPADAGAPWAREAVVYGVIPFAFGYRGFADVRVALDRLQDLGVTTLWMSPVFDTLRFEFGYAVMDYFAIRNDYGGRPELARLIDAAHARGMRVLFDIAANHTSDRHPYFRKAQREGERSHQYGYYQRDRHGDPVHYFDWEDLPNLDYDNPEVRRWLSEVLIHWVRELDIDGYRFDVAWGIRERRPDAWPELLAELRRVKPDVLLLAEATAREPYYDDTGFDLAYDWTDELGQWAWHDVFTDPDRLVARLDAAIAAAPGHEVFRFLNNNDTRERFIDRYGVGMTRAAAALLLTLPGVPCIYCGDEVGALLDPYETYGPIDWTTHPDLAVWYAELTACRASVFQLTTEPFVRLSASPARSVYAYARGGVQVVINFGAGAVSARVTPERVGWHLDRLSGEMIPPGPVSMTAYGARVLVPVRRD